MVSHPVPSGNIQYYLLCFGMQKMNSDAIVELVTPAMIEAGEQAFDYPSDYLSPTILKENLPAVFAAMVLACLESKHLEVGAPLQSMK